MPSSQQVVPVVVLFDYLLSDSGAGMSGQRVTVVLNSTAPATSVSPPTVIAQVQQSTTTDGNGYWQFSLVPNTNISPSNTTYTVLTPAGTYDVTLGAVGPYQSTALGTIVNVPVPLTAPAPSSIPSLLVGAGEPGIDTATAGALLIGDNTATSVEIGSGAVPININGQIVATSSTGVQINAAGDISARSITLSPNGPYVPSAAAGYSESFVRDRGGQVYNVMSSKFGALGNGSDDTASIQAAALAAKNAGGGTVYLPYPVSGGFYGISGSLPLYQFVGYDMPPGVRVKWIGSAPGADTYMLGCVAVGGAYIDRPAIRNLTLDAASLAHVIPLQLDSVRQGYFENLYLLQANGGAGQYGLKMLSSLGNTGLNNTTMNNFIGLHMDSCQRGIQFNGNQSGTGPTNNYFHGLTLTGMIDAFMDFQQWCDSNYFIDVVCGGASNSTALKGMTFGDPVSDLGVHSIRFRNISMDSVSGNASQVMIVLQVTSSIMFDQLYSGVGGVGGITAFEAGTLFTEIAGTGSYRIEWINQGAGPSSTYTIIFEKARRWLSGAQQVNGIEAVGNTAGNDPYIAAKGTDTNISMQVRGQGTGQVRLGTNLANFLAVNPNTTGNDASLIAGGDANANLQINANGSGDVRLQAGAGGKVEVYKPLKVDKDLQRSRQTPTETVLVSGVDATAGELVGITISAARLVGAPLNPSIGQRLTFNLVQGGAGAFAITWNAAFKGITGGTSGATGTRASFSFDYDGTNWNLNGAQPTWVA